MAEFINKHSIKIQIGVLISIIITIIYWTSTASEYIYTVENNTLRLDKVEIKLDNLATKQDLQILKQDIKDFLK